MKIILKLALLLVGNFVHAQSVTDAFLFTQEDLNGTARYTGMAGAFGALGGDLSAIADNPAAASVFAFSEMGISSFFTSNETTASYFSTQTQNNFNQLRLHQFGMVFTLKNTDTNSDWSKIAFAFNSKRVADFSNKSNAYGTNPNKSLGDYFTHYADGLPLNNIEVFEDETIPDIYEYLGNEFGYAAQQAFLGYQAYVINPISDTENNTKYQSNLAPGSVLHDWVYRQQGRHQKYNFTFSTQYRSLLNLGVSLNSHQYEYEQHDALTEVSNEPSSVLQQTHFKNQLNTEGSGISVQVGLIAKVSNAIRLGLSYDSPLYLRFEEEGSQYLETEGFLNNERITTIVNPEVINRFPQYRMQLPSKLTASIAFVFQKRGLMSMSYSYRDISNTQFDTDSQASYLGGLNATLQQQLDAQSVLRIGTEWRTGRFLWQAGFYNADSGLRNVNKKNHAYTTGVQFDLGGNLIGASWVFNRQYTERVLYPAGLTSKVGLEKNSNQLFFTYLFKL